MLYHLLGGVLTYSIAVSICYWPAVKDGPYYFPIGLLCGLIANGLWLHLARAVGAQEKVLVAGFYWDSMIVGMYALIPVLFFGVRVSWTTALGLCLIVVGIALSKY